MPLLHKILILLSGVAISVHAVPPVINYAGQVAVNGEAFDGQGLFKFALVNTDGTTTYWSNDGTSVDGSEPQASVTVSVNGGLYAVLLGNTAQQGMGAIDPAVFAQHTDAKLRVWFSDGVNGFQQLSPDRPFASVPYAFNSESAKSAETAKTADSANVAMAVQAGAVTSSMLASSAVTSDKLSPQIKADINATIGMNRLSTEVTEKLNQEKTTNNYNAPSVGSLLAVPYGSDAPAGYSLYQRGEPKELVWEEKAPVSVARMVYDGADIIEGKIYVMGGYSSDQGTPINYDVSEVYDPSSNSWSTLSPMSAKRPRAASSVLDDKLYAIGGSQLDSVEIFDPTTGFWSQGTAIPEPWVHAQAVTYQNKIYLFGGSKSSALTNELLVFDPTSNTWNNKENMPIARSGIATVIFQKRIWVFGGSSNKVHSYDPEKNTWQNESDSLTHRSFPVAWLGNGRIYLAGGVEGSEYFSSIEAYDPITETWATQGRLPENKFVADAVVLNDKVYVIAGQPASGVFSNKVYAADLNSSVKGVYDLYRKDGDAPVGTPILQSEYADGSVTGSKMADGAITTDKLNEQILKYLKPEITNQPQSSTIYARQNASYSVTAEGKYLTYQWKKDGVDLTGETNATLNITDANATLHDGNYSVLVSNDFGSVESGEVEVKISDSLLNGLLAWWAFDGNGSDISGNDRHSTPHNTYSYVTGKVNQAIRIVGDSVNPGTGTNGGHIIIPYIDILEIGNFAICLWVKEEQYHYNSGGEDYINFGSLLKIGNNEQLTFNSSVDSSINRNSWNHFSLNYGTVTKVGFLNGQQVMSDSWQIPSSVQYKKSAIGRHWWGGESQSSTRLTCLIDDVRIYDRALSAEEVQALYNLGQ